MAQHGEWFDDPKYNVQEVKGMMQEEEIALRESLKVFYRKNNPQKLKEVETFMERIKQKGGKEEFEESLLNTYGETLSIWQVKKTVIPPSPVKETETSTIGEMLQPLLFLAAAVCIGICLLLMVRFAKQGGNWFIQWLECLADPSCAIF